MTNMPLLITLILLLIAIPAIAGIAAIIYVNYFKQESVSNENTKVKTKYIIVAIIVVVELALLVATIQVSPDNGGSGGDDEPSCRNCGRSPVVPGFDLCETCYEGFVDWQEDNWKD